MPGEPEITGKGGRSSDLLPLSIRIIIVSRHNGSGRTGDITDAAEMICRVIIITGIPVAYSFFAVGEVAFGDGSVGGAFFANARPAPQPFFHERAVFAFGDSPVETVVAECPGIDSHAHTDEAVSGVPSECAGAVAKEVAVGIVSECLRRWDLDVPALSRAVGVLAEVGGHGCYCIGSGRGVNASGELVVVGVVSADAVEGDV